MSFQAVFQEEKREKQKEKTMGALVRSRRLLGQCGSKGDFCMLSLLYVLNEDLIDSLIRIITQMGNSQSNPFREGSQLMSEYTIQQRIPQLFLTFLKKRISSEQFLLRQFTFNELRQFTIQLDKLNKRKTIKHQNLTNLIRVQDRTQDQMCSNFYKIYTLWEYPRRTLVDEIASKTLQNKPFDEQRIWKLATQSINALSILQQSGQSHQCLCSKNILIDDKENFKVADPLSYGSSANIEHVLSNRANKSIYLSPEQCESVSSQRPNFNKNAYKNDVFTFGLILLESGLLEKMDKCFVEDYSSIRQIVLKKNIERFGERYGKDLQLFVEIMTNFNVEARPDWLELQKIIQQPRSQTKQPLIAQNIIDPKTSYRNSQQSNINKASEPVVYMTPEPNFQKILRLPLPSIPSVSNQGSVNTRQDNRTSITSNFPQMYSNISSIPQYSYVSPAIASPNTSHIQQPTQPQFKNYLPFEHRQSVQSNIVPQAQYQYISPITQSNHVRVDSNHMRIDSRVGAFPSQNTTANYSNHSHSNGSNFGVTFGQHFYQPSRIQPQPPSLQPYSYRQPPIPQPPQKQLPTQQPFRPTASSQPILRPSQLASYPSDQISNSQQVYVQQNFSKGSRYIGWKLNGMRHGQGKFFYQDGGRYQGFWSQNSMNGFGKLYYQSDKIAYQGQWLKDQFHGKGKLYNQQPIYLNIGFNYENFDEIQEFWQYYEGNFTEDLKNGFGQLRFSNGQVFEGSFVDDMVQGEGRFHCKDGQIIHGIWLQNHLVNRLE